MVSGWQVRKVILMFHRHIQNSNETMDLSAPAVEDIIFRGDMDSKRTLFRKVAENPFGKTARFLEQIVSSGNTEIEQSLVLWRRFLNRARAGKIW